MLVFVLLKILEQLSSKGSDTILFTNYNGSTCWISITMSQHAGYRLNREELLKSKLSPEYDDYTFWLSKETEKNKSVIKWKGSITALKDFFRKKFGCQGQWSYIEAGRDRPTT